MLFPCWWSWRTGEAQQGSCFFLSITGLLTASIALWLWLWLWLLLWLLLLSTIIIQYTKQYLSGWSIIFLPPHIHLHPLISGYLNRTAHPVSAYLHDGLVKNNIWRCGKRVNVWLRWGVWGGREGGLFRYPSFSLRSLDTDTDTIIREISNKLNQYAVLYSPVL